MHVFRLGAGLAAAALLVLTPTGATAASQWFSDAHGDVKSSVDIHRVRLFNGSHQGPAVRVTVVQRELRAGDGFDVWLDTDAADPGPEFRAAWFANSDSLGVRMVESFSDMGQQVACPLFRVRSAQDDPGESSHVFIPRPCLDYPGSVRISVRAQRAFAHTTATDWAPSVLHFYPWVARG